MTKKLRSDRGASITFSLLLFLVCAVLSTVIIVASTAAAGRMSSLVENDQRYYAVTSAAQLLEDVLGDETITIVKEDEKTRTTEYKADGDVKEIDLSGVKSTNIYLIEGKGYDVTTISKNGKLISGTGSESFKPKDIAEYMAYQYAKLKYPVLQTGSSGASSGQEGGSTGLNGGQMPKSSEIKLNFDVSGDLSSLDVSLTGTLNEDGSLTLTVTSEDGKYKLNMNFEADEKNSKDELSEEDAAALNRNDNKIVEKVKDYTNTSLSWQLTGVELYR